ncbi:hypothetical protein O5D80_005267 [Batrachochytrium dendrobatidis]|nr:hypothetical protein O5D80_005267 [Batrachochytrium dendrobatidis]
MNTVQINSALLCDSEVLNFLQESTKRRSKKQNTATFQDLHTVEYEVVTYLSALPCKDQAKPQVNSFLEAIKTWSLTKAEKLQLLNLRPVSAIELSAIIEECEIRFTEDQLTELLQILNDTLPYDKPVLDNIQE